MSNTQLHSFRGPDQRLQQTGRTRRSGKSQHICLRPAAERQPH